MRIRPRSTAPAVTLAAVLLLAGCGGSTGTESAASTGEAPASSSAAGSPSASSAAPAPADSADADAEAAAPAFPADTSADTSDAASPAGLTLTSVRTGSHDGYDRVVFEFAGSGTPGWRAEYVEGAVAQGSGDPIEVPGAAILQLDLNGISYPYETGATEVARGPLAASGTDVVQGAFYDGTFEGVAVAWVGTAAETPFRVFALSNPTRVVVDVVHAP
ncbi:AMIN-like domain-containing (lipo)protein [Modestobacter marinus]|uniref:AMIN-like domain-containing (lipo)protein n=1 Tax=Modestobacter marinus TaxID=477641 RepID=UPI001C961B9B|nr:hypothetical protein [Modestobacter marinus]